jgi:phosphatidylglycerol:prolipoprotein diacylglycerol transferase
VQQVLFHIPPEIGGFAVFGFGWLLLAWCAGCAIWLLVLARRHGWTQETLGHLPMMLLVAVVIALVLPRLQATTPSGEVLGLPIRGYGVMLLLGMVAGVALSAYQAYREGIRPDFIISLAMVMVVAGIAGARLFFVIQYWPQFQRDSLWATLAEIAKFTEGGLVVYGSVAGGLLAGVLYVRWQRLRLLRIGDIIAPGMLLGLALGRIGCLLNGCCWGGMCENEYLAVRFPQGSPAYMDQVQGGTLLGLELVPDPRGESPEARGGPWLVLGVRPHSPAAEAGIEAGNRIEQMYVQPSDIWKEARRRDDRATAMVRLELEDDRIMDWSWDALPAASLPLHPTQIYSSINAALLCLFLWSFFPFRRRNGEVFAWMLTIYPVSRFLLERIRSDEPGQWGTPLTISQWFSLGLLLLAAIFWAYVVRQPQRSVQAEAGQDLSGSKRAGEAVA